MQALFANFIPEIVNILTSGGKFGGRFERQKGKRHVVVCGHITTSSVTTFLADFLHKDRKDVDVKAIFLNQYRPDR